MKSTNNIPDWEDLQKWLGIIIHNEPGQDRLKKLMESGAIFNEALEDIADELATNSKEEAVQRYVATVSETTGMRELELHLCTMKDHNEPHYKVALYALVNPGKRMEDAIFGALARVQGHSGTYVVVAGRLK